MSYIICGTGHRPDKLGGYSLRVSNKLITLARAELEILKPDEVISGMALGWDQALAEAAIDLGIPFIAAVPFEGQQNKWPMPSRIAYQILLRKAKEVVIVKEGGYATWKMQKRNVWMVDRSTTVLALWSGSSGGTKNCIEHAKIKGKNVINLWEKWRKLT
jgi:uncharacterized phage-like protein YoqJ